MRFSCGLGSLFLLRVKAVTPQPGPYDVVPAAESRSRHGRSGVCERRPPDPCLPFQRIAGDGFDYPLCAVLSGGTDVDESDP